MINKKQFDYILKFISESASGRKHSEENVKAAKCFLFEPDKWNDFKVCNDSRDNYFKKKYGQKLAEKIMFWHGFFNNWSDDIEAQLSAFKTTGAKPIGDNVVSAVIEYKKGESKNMNAAALANDCYMGSVKSALAKIEKFDNAAKEYGEL